MMYVQFLLLFFVCCIYCTDPPPPPEPDFPDWKNKFVGEPEASRLGTRELCKKALHHRIIAPLKTILGIGTSVCYSRSEGTKVKTMWFMIRNKIFPFFMTGTRQMSVTNLDQYDQLGFLSSSTRMGLMVMGFFEYTDVGGDAGFDWFTDKDRLTEFFMLNKQDTAVDKFVNWRKPKYFSATLSNGVKTHTFTVDPDFTRWNRSAPVFSMKAFLVEGQAYEPKIGTGGTRLRGMKMNANGIKIGMNVSNARCVNPESTGVGIVMLMITQKGVKKKGGGVGHDPDVNKPDDPSDTNEVHEIEGEAKNQNGYMGFAKQVGVKSGNTMIGKEAFLKTLNYTRTRLKFGKRFVYLNETNMEYFKLKQRKIDIMVLSINDCNLDSYYWDPTLGFSDYLSDYGDEDMAYVGVPAFLLIALLFLVL